MALLDCALGISGVAGELKGEGEGTFTVSTILKTMTFFALIDNRFGISGVAGELQGEGDDALPFGVSTFLVEGERFAVAFFIDDFDRVGTGGVPGVEGELTLVGAGDFAAGDATSSGLNGLLDFLEDIESLGTGGVLGDAGLPSFIKTGDFTTGESTALADFFFNLLNLGKGGVFGLLISETPPPTSSSSSSSSSSSPSSSSSSSSSAFSGDSSKALTALGVTQKFSKAFCLAI